MSGGWEFPRQPNSEQKTRKWILVCETECRPDSIPALIIVYSFNRRQPRRRSRIRSAINAKSHYASDRDQGCTQGYHRPPGRAGESFNVAAVSADPDDQLPTSKRGRCHCSNTHPVHHMVSGVDAGPARDHNSFRWDGWCQTEPDEDAILDHAQGRGAELHSEAERPES